MLLYIFEDEHGWIYEPHGTEIEVRHVTYDGGELLKASGWRPYEMHRVSRYVHDTLLIEGLLTSVRSSSEEQDPPLISKRVMANFNNWSLADVHVNAKGAKTCQLTDGGRPKSHSSGCALRTF